MKKGAEAPFFQGLTDGCGLQIKYGAGNEARTRDLHLGKVALYQLSYSRIFLHAAYFTALFLVLLSRVLTFAALVHPEHRYSKYRLRIIHRHLLTCLAASTRKYSLAVHLFSPPHLVVCEVLFLQRRNKF